MAVRPMEICETGRRGPVDGPRKSNPNAS